TERPPAYGVSLPDYASFKPTQCPGAKDSSLDTTSSPGSTRCRNALLARRYLIQQWQATSGMSTWVTRPSRIRFAISGPPARLTKLELSAGSTAIGPVAWWPCSGARLVSGHTARARSFADVCPANRSRPEVDQLGLDDPAGRPPFTDALLDPLDDLWRKEA